MGGYVPPEASTGVLHAPSMPSSAVWMPSRPPVGPPHQAARTRPSGAEAAISPAAAPVAAPGWRETTRGGPKRPFLVGRRDERISPLMLQTTTAAPRGDESTRACRTRRSLVITCRGPTRPPETRLTVRVTRPRVSTRTPAPSRAASTGLSGTVPRTGSQVTAAAVPAPANPVIAMARAARRRPIGRP